MKDIDYKHTVDQLLELVYDLKKREKAYWELHSVVGEIRMMWKHGDYSDEAYEVLDKVYGMLCECLPEED